MTRGGSLAGLLARLTVFTAGRASANEAASFRRLAKAAQAGDCEAQYELGQCYLHGTGVLRNPADAAFWYRRAAEQGHCQAQYRLSLVYFKGGGATGAGLEEWRRTA
ncbi:MAG: sel1 repeat family protein, partial [Stellaceae bacterium]